MRSGDALEIIHTHRPIASIPSHAFQTAVCGVLTGVEVFAVAFAVVDMNQELGDDMNSVSADLENRAEPLSHAESGFGPESSDDCGFEEDIVRVFDDGSGLERLPRDEV